METMCVVQRYTHRYQLKMRAEWTSGVTIPPVGWSRAARRQQRSTAAAVQGGGHVKQIAAAAEAAAVVVVVNRKGGRHVKNIAYAPICSRHATRLYSGASDGVNSGDGLWSKMYTSGDDDVDSGDLDISKGTYEESSPLQSTVNLSRSDDQFLKDCIEFTYGKVGPSTTADSTANDQEEELSSSSDQSSYDEEQCNWTPSHWSSQSSINLDDLNNLFQKVKFPRRPHDKLITALSNSHTVITARAARKSRWAKKGQIIGFARTTSDRAFNATIWDVAVDPAWQRIGIGRALVERTIVALQEDGVSNITLFGEPNVVAMYKKLGFDADPDGMGIKGMALMRKEKIGSHQ